MAKTKALISFAVTTKLICVFVFANAKIRFSHVAAHMIVALRKHVRAMSAAIFHDCKNGNFQLKNCDIYSYFCSKHRSWVHVRTASLRRFLLVPTIHALEKKKSVYPCSPQFYYIKVGCKDVFITRTFEQDGIRMHWIRACDCMYYLPKVCNMYISFIDRILREWIC